MSKLPSKKKYLCSTSISVWNEFNGKITIKLKYILPLNLNEMVHLQKNTNQNGQLNLGMLKDKCARNRF